MPTSSPINYVDSDFDAIKTALTNRLISSGIWKDTYEGGTGQMLIEFHAAVASFLLFYIERRTEECFLGTAQNKSSIVNLARLVGYTPARTISALGVVTFSIPSVATTRVRIPQYTICTTANGVEFLTMQDVAIEVGQSSCNIDVIEGELVTIGPVAGDGAADREIAIQDTLVENDSHTSKPYFHSFRVIVDDVDWVKVASFLESEGSDIHYMLRAELDDTLTIIFGNDIAGKIVGTDSTIEIKYVRSSGSAGNVFSSGMITTISGIVYDANGVAVSNISVTNTSACLGGDDAETAEQIRVNAPAVFATGDRLVTKQDFITFIRAYDSVADVNVWGENEESAPNYSMFNKVKICMLLDDWADPSATFKGTLTTDLYDKSMLTVKYEYIQATQLNIIASLTVKVKRGYSLSQTQTDIETALENEFVLGTTSKLGTSKYKSNIVQAVDELAAVSYHHLTLYVRKDLSYLASSNGNWQTTLDAYPVKTSSVSVYATLDSDDVLIGQDDGAGVITDAASDSSRTVSGTIDYATGELLVGIDPETGVNGVYAVYEQDENGDIVVDNNEICKLYSVDITSIGY